MKILWLDINSSYSHSSLALASLHAQLMSDREYSYLEWATIRGSLKSDEDEIIMEAIGHNADIIFASLWLFNHDYMTRLIAKIKRLLPKTVVVLGGPEFLGDNQEFLLANPDIDAVFRGEGEHFVKEWLPHYHHKERWSSVEGLCYMNDGVYIDGGKVIISDFAALEYPEKSPFFVLDRNFVQLETSRGCFNSCHFCVSGKDKPVRNQSIEQIKQRLDFLAQSQASSVRMLDRTFNGSSSRCRQMLELMRQYDGTLNFHLEVHPALMRGELAELFSTMPKDLLHVEAGIQSLRQDVIDSCHRGGSVEESLKGLEFLFAMEDRMHTHADLIAGLPGYSYNDLVEDCRKLVVMGASEVQLELLKLLPGTVMRSNASELGIKYSPKPPYEVLATPHISFGELKSSMILSRLLDLYYNHSAFNSLFRDIASDAELIQSMIDHYSKIGNLFAISAERIARLMGEFLVSQNSSLITKFQDIWIAQGLNIRKMVGFVSIEPQQSYLDRNFGHLSAKELSRMRCYKVASSHKEWIVIYDRQVEHSKPLDIVSVQ